MRFQLEYLWQSPRSGLPARHRHIPHRVARSVFSTHQRQRRRILQAMGAAALPFGLLSCSSEEKASALVVGGLPVTCNLTLPVACEARAAANKAGPGFAFEYSKYSGWPEI